jgi:hypothetical protein
MKFVSKIEDSFQISGRGCVIVIPKSSLPSTDRIKIGDFIQLRNTDGRVFETHIAGIEMLCGPRVRGDVSAFLLPDGIPRSEIPPGTEFWLVRAE